MQRLHAKALHPPARLLPRLHGVLHHTLPKGLALQLVTARRPGRLQLRENNNRSQIAAFQL
jgi:hypothetical protein